MKHRTLHYILTLLTVIPITTDTPYRVCSV